MSTFYNPSMMQMYASQGYAPPEDEYAQVTGMDPQTQYGGNQMGYQPGSQNNALVGSGMNPYMLDTFGMGQYYRPYGNLAQQQQPQQPPQQPYYQVPTEYIPEGTPGLNQTQQPTQQNEWWNRYQGDTLGLDQARAAAGGMDRLEFIDWFHNDQDMWTPSTTQNNALAYDWRPSLPDTQAANFTWDYKTGQYQYKPSVSNAGTDYGPGMGA